MHGCGLISVTGREVWRYLRSDDDDLVEALPRACFRLTLTSLIELWGELLGVAVPRPGACSCCCCCWGRDIRDLRLKKPTTLIGHQKNHRAQWQETVVMISLCSSVRCNAGKTALDPVGPCTYNRVNQGSYEKENAKRWGGWVTEILKMEEKALPSSPESRRVKWNVLNYGNNYQRSRSFEPPIPHISMPAECLV
jgi:hypothetical protein